MQAKPLVIGLVVLAVAILAGLGIRASMDDSESSSATNQNGTSQTENSNTEDNNERQTITQLAASTDSLSTLVAAVQAAGLAETLNDTDSEFTVFAPSNSAFEKLPAGTVETLVAPESRDLLTTILTYHVVPSVALSSSLSDGQTITTVQGGQLTVRIDGGNVFIEDATGGRAQVTTADVRASNGVVHIIDSVLMPQ